MLIVYKMVFPCVIQTHRKSNKIQDKNGSIINKERIVIIKDCVSEGKCCCD